MEHSPKLAGNMATAADLSHLRDGVIVFDLDGTLADTAPDLVSALNTAMGNEGLPPVQLSDVRAMVGRGSRALIVRALARLGTSYPDMGVDALQADFLDAYQANPVAHSQLFPGVIEALETLRTAGAHLVVATNKPDVLALPVIDGLGLAPYFERIVGANAAPKRKPHRDHLIAAAGEFGLSRAVMVGDSAPDVGAARHAGIPVVLMGHGYSETPMQKLLPDALISGFERLPETISALMSRMEHAPHQ